jgi:hypothetical protein
LGWICPARYDDGVVFVLDEGVSVVVGVCNVLSLVLWDIDGVDGDYTVGLIGEETASVVVIYDN